MLRTFDIILVVVMTGAATVTYSIKHRAELKLEEVRKIEAEIRLEKDTIDLLKADWALLSQPNRLQKLIDAYSTDLALVPTASTQLARPNELPMLKADVPPPPEDKKKGKDGKTKGGASATGVPVASAKGVPAQDDVAAIISGGQQPASHEQAPANSGAEYETDDMSTGSVEQ